MKWFQLTFSFIMLTVWHLKNIIILLQNKYEMTIMIKEYTINVKILKIFLMDLQHT